MPSAGISGLGVAMATAGGFLVYTAPGTRPTFLLRFARVPRWVRWTTAALLGICLAGAAVLYIGPLSVLAGRRHLVELVHVYAGYALSAPMFRFLELVGDIRDGRTLPPELDVERYPRRVACNGVGGDVWVAYISSFVTEVKARTGVTPVIYSAKNFWRACVGGTIAFARDTLLFAAQWNVAAGRGSRYGSAPAPADSPASPATSTWASSSALRPAFGHWSSRLCEAGRRGFSASFMSSPPGGRARSVDHLIGRRFGGSSGGR